MWETIDTSGLILKCKELVCNITFLVTFACLLRTVKLLIVSRLHGTLAFILNDINVKHQKVQTGKISSCMKLNIHGISNEL